MFSFEGDLGFAWNYFWRRERHDGTVFEERKAFGIFLAIADFPKRQFLSNGFVRITNMIQTERKAVFRCDGIIEPGSLQLESDCCCPRPVVLAENQELRA